MRQALHLGLRRQRRADPDAGRIAALLAVGEGGDAQDLCRLGVHEISSKCWQGEHHNAASGLLLVLDPGRGPDYI
jgi:hypothetical protein